MVWEGIADVDYGLHRPCYRASRWEFRVLTVFMALALLAQGAGQERSAAAPAAAERLAKATSLPDDELFVSFQTNLPAARRQALEAAMAESRADADGLRTALAATYARHLSKAEMEAAADFFESPVGASFEQKILKRQPDRLSAEERRAAQTFAQTPAGLAFRAKEQAVGRDMMPIIKTFGEKLIGRAQLIHCRVTKACDPLFQ